MVTAAHGYQDRYIRVVLARLGRADVSPRIVEGFLRCYHSTLDSFGLGDFTREIVHLLPEIDRDGPRYGERIAESYGL